MSDHHTKQLLDLINEQNETIKALADERDKLQAELAAFVTWADSDLDALSYLQRTYCDPSAPRTDRIKSSGIAINFERAKPPSASIIGTINLYDALEAKPPVTIEHESSLASDHAGEALAGPEAD
jgi:hypothetical protein